LHPPVAAGMAWLCHLESHHLDKHNRLTRVPYCKYFHMGDELKSFEVHNE